MTSLDPQRDYLPSEEESESDNDEFLQEEHSLTKEQIAEECQALQDEAEMDIEQLRKLYGHIEDENTEPKKPEPNSEDHLERRASLLPKLINSGELDDYDEEDDKDYTPQTASFKYKDPRIGENYQVDEKNIPELKVALDYGNDADFETNLWAPSSDCDAAKFLTDYRKKKKMRPEVNEKVRNRCLADCEDALSQLMICNYRTSAAHKRIQARARLTPKRKWTNEDIANFELGLSLKGKNFFKIQKEHLPKKTIKDLVEYYYYWKKSSRFDSFTAKTRGLKRKFDGNSTNYMEKLLDEIENKRSKRGEKHDEQKSDRASKKLKDKNGASSDSESRGKVMTLEFSGNSWKVGTENR